MHTILGNDSYHQNYFISILKGSQREIVVMEFDSSRVSQNGLDIRETSPQIAMLMHIE